MDATQLDNDTRGWIMTAVSGIACVFGSSIICVDILVRWLRRGSKFKIEDSNKFLASSLSLSFGVMMFSALFSMLPSSKKYLTDGGCTPEAASWILLACFVGGFLGIQIVSRFLHHYMPSHVVGCDHHHDVPHPPHSHRHSRTHSFASHRSRRASRRIKSRSGSTSINNETAPLLPATAEPNGIPALKTRHTVSGMGTTDPSVHQQPPVRRPSLVNMQNRVISFVKDIKNNCDSGGPCYGYSDPCGQGCYKHITPKVHGARSTHGLVHTWTDSVPYQSIDNSADGGLNGRITPRSVKQTGPTGVTRSRSLDATDVACESEEESDMEAQHHHHVPENAFMSIGLQTSIAIALHKLPEGFITYATNHVNPNLGFAVFMALFIHNITEGFALALPLYLALGSRLRAMSWSSVLGGLSQPLGAGVAAAWFQFAGKTGRTPGSVGYGCMFAVTAGIMTSVALSLFVESLSFNHDRNLCMAFAFIGMTIMGLSNALTAH
ncbi:ZIP zinc transporter [Xylogone sp. PMI_703]|nr:ZIP zinc transporter [Xylogone sp. PMI_703]